MTPLSANRIAVLVTVLAGLLPGCGGSPTSAEGRPLPPVCSKGPCEIVVAETGGVVDLAVDATGIYWSSGEFLARQAFGSDQGLALAPIQGTTFGAFALGSDGVYVGEPLPGTVARLAPGQAPVTLASHQVAPGVVALDATNVYWNAAGAILETPRAGGPVVTLASGLSVFTPLAVGGGRVYFGDCFEPPTRCAVRSVPVVGGDVATVAGGYAGVASFAATPDAVYYAAGSGGSHNTIVRLPLDGAAPTQVTLFAEPACFVVDDTSLYFVDLLDGSIGAMPLDLGPVTTLVQGRDEVPQALAVDATSIYWSAGPYVGAGSKIWRAPK